ncbi:hypothetical protein [Campylobacter ureolyticus]|uniref:hypothetical protein n=1 Tax=Campylobacter ureolyticus TaxID=827 RepID=UPI00290DCC75|nr:hypothetical protein [Campylobacter ureolyticus]MDU5326736.1 hypothetical protein [Campylobacter ureolyticus]
MLSQTILKQNAKTSIKYGLEAGVFDGALQIGSQITDQVIDVGGSVDFRKISLDWDNISRSIISGAVIAPNFFDSSKTIIHSWKANKNLEKQLSNANTINRQNKIQGRIDKIIINLRITSIFKQPIKCLIKQ